MKKVFFSLKRLNRATFGFLAISIVGVIFWFFFIIVLSGMIVSYTKGSSLLIEYTENYFLSLYDRNVFSPEMVRDLENKIEGFYVFYELLYFKERKYSEIEKIWIDFGMDKGEVPLFVYGTTVMRNLPVMNEVKESARKLKDKIDYCKLNGANHEDIEEVVIYLKEFHQSFYSTLYSVIYPSVFIISIFVFLLVGEFSWYLFKSLKLLNEIIAVISDKIDKILKKQSLEKIDIIDPRSECVVLQNSVNLMADRLNEIEKKKQGIVVKITQISESIEKATEILSSYIEIISGLKEGISKLNVDVISNMWDTLSRAFSVVDSEIKRLSTSIDSFRSLSGEIFEPISTLYSIIQESSDRYNLLKNTIFKYIYGTKDLVNSIQFSFEKLQKNVESIISELKRTSTNLRSIGINASVEFSKVSSSSEALSNISNRIVELSRELGTTFGSIKENMKSFNIELKQDINKVLSHIEVLSEISKDLEEISLTITTLSQEKDRVDSNIRYAYQEISNVLESISRVGGESEKIKSVFFEIEKKFKEIIEIMSVFINIYENINSISDIYHLLVDVNSYLKQAIKELEEV